MTPLILASSSSYRQSLLNRLQIPYETASPEINESRHKGENPKAMARRLSEEKAVKVSDLYKEHLIIGSDQVAELNGETLGKPGNHHNAQQQLKQQAGQTVLFHTGLCLYNSLTGSTQTDTVTTEVTFRALTEDEIEQYLRKEQPYNCAGSFMAEQLGISLFTKLKSDDPSALIGLPLIRLCQMLREEGISTP